MISNLEPSAQRFLDSLNRIRRTTQEAQQQLSSGVRVSAPSDAPNDISKILQLQVSLDRNDQIQINLNRTKTGVDTAEQALQSAVTLMDRAAVLTSQACGVSQTAATRAALAEEAKGILQQMVSLSATTMEGRYIFSGDQDQIASYTLELNDPVNAPNGVLKNQTATATRQAEDAAGAHFVVGRTAEEIFDSPAANVFATLNALRQALSSNDTAALTNLNTTVRSASDHLNSQLSFYGITQSRLSDAQTAAENAELQLKTELSGLRDTDTTEAVLQMTQGSTNEQVALAARAQLPRKSLFDLLG